MHRLKRKEDNNMIDYIKIMNLIIAFIRSTTIPVDLDNLLNSSDIKIPVMHQVMISKGTLDAFINISIIILLLAFAINCLLTIIFASDKENEEKKYSHRIQVLYSSCNSILCLYTFI